MSDIQTRAAVDDLWAAVDSITKPTALRVHRDAPEDEPWLRGPLLCDVAAHKAVIVSHGQVPPLWDQAEQAVMTGNEQQEGGRSPVGVRSPADLDLMELLLTIRESMTWQLPGRGVTPRGGIPDQMRQLASHVVGREPQHIGWWTYRFAQWGRLLAVYLHAVDSGPKPVRLRNLPCPECAATHVVTREEYEEEPTVKPAIQVDFVNGWIRAAQCTACSAAWWRGSDLWDLARSVADDMPKLSDDGERIGA